MYRIILNGKVIPFKSYSEALDFQDKNGGTLYVKVYGD